MKKIMFEGETVDVLEVSEIKDGHHYKVNVKIKFRGELYSLYDEGVGCYCCRRCGIIKMPFDSSYNNEQGIVEECDWLHFGENNIRNLLGLFINYGAKTSWEIDETHVYVDKVEQKDEEEV